MIGMERRAQAELATRLRELHEKPPLVLPNAWRAGSALMIDAVNGLFRG
jgi:2-methylisocitrate lyase-like PEP mutase family enzyme